MAIKAIIFDCFGVLATDGWLSFRNKYFGSNPELLKEAKELNKHSDAAIISYSSYISKIAAMAKVDESSVRQVLDSRVRNEELIEYIRVRLKPGYKIGLLSNVSGNWLDKVIGESAVKLFDQVVLSYQLGAVKPDRIMYDTIVKKLGVNYDECVFIDDQVRYCEGAQILGIKTILFKDNEQALGELEAILGSGRA